MAEKFTKICDLRPYMKGVNCVFMVLEKGSITKTKENHTLSHSIVADSTASIHLSLWDTQGDYIHNGDIIRLTGGYTTLFKSSLVLYAGRQGTLERIGEFTMIFSETPNMSAFDWATDPANKNAMIPLPTAASSMPPSAAQLLSGELRSSTGPPPGAQMY